MIEVSKGNPYICGASKLNNKTYNFTIVTDSDDVSLLIYDNKFNLKHEIKLGSEYRFGGALSLCLSKESLDKALYCYKLDGKFYIDPYSKTISNKNKFGIKSEDEELFLSRVVLDPYDWSLDKDVKLPFSDMILYKMHARGFTKSRTSQVLAKGTFAGIEEKLPYLRKLGITAVELMPVYEFDETGRYEQLHEQNSIYRAAPSRAAVNYWGYTKGFHFALKPSFCSIAGTKSDYTTEFKDLVKAMHRAGLEMILEFYFDKEPYEYVKECLRFYKDEYHIDGAHIYSRDYVIYGLAEDPNFRDFKIIVDNLYMMYSDYSDLLDKKKKRTGWRKYVPFLGSEEKSSKADDNEEEGNTPELFTVTKEFNRKKAFLITDSNVSRLIFPSCCRPIPGDDTLGFIDNKNHIEVHRRDCPVANKLKTSFGNRIIDVKWDTHRRTLFDATIQLSGIDRIGLLNEVTGVISSQLNINMQKLVISCKDGIFEGTIEMKVSDRNEVNRIIKSLRKIKDLKEINQITQ